MSLEHILLISLISFYHISIMICNFHYILEIVCTNVIINLSFVYSANCLYLIIE